MPVLINADANRVVVVNFKVMYSTLKAQPAYREMSTVGAMRFIAGRSMAGNRPPILLIVRNPYARLVSLFKDKFRQNARTLEQDGQVWSHFHRMLFPYIGLPPNPSPEEGRERLLKVEFPELMELLPTIYRQDTHLHPQTDLLQKIPGVRPEWWLQRISLARMENLDPVELQERWQIDVGVRENVTGGSADYEVYFTPRGFAIANDLYARDFELLGYRRQE